MTEFELRQMALQMALSAMPHSPHVDLKSAEGIVKTAATFEAYLRGPGVETQAVPPQLASRFLSDLPELREDAP